MITDANFENVGNGQMSDANTQRPQSHHTHDSIDHDIETFEVWRALECLADSKIRARTRTSKATTDF